MLRQVVHARHQYEASGRPIAADLFELACSLLDDLVANPRDEVLLHGDFHPNILASTRAPWLAIDPIPMIGERTYEFVQFTLFRRGDLPDPASQLREHAARIASMNNLELERLLRWCTVKLIFDALLS